jgi:hypothetical protein
MNSTKPKLMLKLQEGDKRPSAEQMANVRAVEQVKGDASKAATFIEGPASWYAVEANRLTTQAAIAGRRFGTDSKVPGYVLVRSGNIEADALKLADVEGAGKVLKLAGAEKYEYAKTAKISEADIAKIGTGPVAKPTAEIAIPEIPM